MIGGKNITRYGLEWDGAYLNYTPEAIHSCKREDIFLSDEKILFRRVSDKIIATIDTEKYYGLHTLVVINIKETAAINLKVLVALLNSNVLNYFFRKVFGSTKTVFSEIGARQVELLPIKCPDENIKKEIEELVNNAIGLRKTNFSADISEVEIKLNNIIYTLYDLSPGEIKIIEEAIRQ